MINIYKSKYIQLDICYEYEYFEVFGLTNKEFEDIKQYYNNLCYTRKDWIQWHLNKP